MITIGRMAEKYGMLPSQVEQHATTYDLMVNDVLATFESYQQQKSEGLVNPDLFGLSVEEMQSMMGKANVK